MDFVKKFRRGLDVAPKDIGQILLKLSKMNQTAILQTRLQNLILNNRLGSDHLELFLSNRAAPMMMIPLIICW